MDVVFLLIVSSIMFGIGAFGAIIHRSAIRKLISLEIMFNAELLLFLSLATKYAPLNGLIFSVFIIALTGSEVGVIIPIIVLLYRRVKTVDVTELARKEGEAP